MRTVHILDLCGFVGRLTAIRFFFIGGLYGHFRTRILGGEGPLDGLLLGSVGQKDPGAFQVGQPQPVASLKNVTEISALGTTFNQRQFPQRMFVYLAGILEPFHGPEAARSWAMPCDDSFLIACFSRRGGWKQPCLQPWLEIPTICS